MMIRSQKGYSLVVTMGIGLVGMMTLLGLSSLVMPSCQRISQTRMVGAMRAACESGTDWCVQQLQTSGSAVDTATYGTSKTTAVPASVLPNAAVNANVTVTNVAPPTASIAYDQSTDYTISGNKIPSNGWRQITSVANIGSKQKQIRVLLKPTYTTVQGPPVPIFQFGIFTVNGLEVNQNATATSINTAQAGGAPMNLGANMGTNNGQIQVGQNANLGGNLVNFSTGQTQIGQNATIQGTVTTNGAASSLQMGQNSNVNGNLMPSGTAPQPVMTAQTNQQMQLAPVPAPPPNAINLGAISVGQNGSYTLAPGSYVVSQLYLSQNATLNIVAGPNGYAPVSIYVQGAGARVKFDQNSVVNNQSGVPANFQIFSTGSNEIEIEQNAKFNGVIYAPNSEFELEQNATLTGAVVASTVELEQNAIFVYDRALASGNTLFWRPNVKQVSQLQVISWEEL